MGEENTEVTGEQGDNVIDPSVLDDAALDKAIAETLEPEQDTVSETEIKEEKGTGEASTETNVADTTKGKSEVETLKEDFDKLKDTLANKEQFIQRQGTEIGDLREKAKAISDDQFDEMYAENPRKALQADHDTKDAQRELAEAEARELDRNTKDIMTQRVSGFENMIDSMAEVLKKDNEPPEMVEAFRRNPYRCPPSFLNVLVSRATQGKQIADLTTQIETLKKKPGEMLDKIENATNAGHTMTGGTSGVAAKSKPFADVTEKSISKMSDAELDALIANDGE